MTLDRAALRSAAGRIRVAADRLSIDAPDGVDVATVNMVANLHCARWSALPADRNAADFHAAFCLFTVLHATIPEKVPDQWAKAFRDKPPVVQPPHEILHAVAVVLLCEDGYDPNRDLAERAAALLAQAVDLIPNGDSSRPAMLFNLGSALRRLFNHTDDVDTLRAAVDCMRQAAGALAVDPQQAVTVWSELGSALELLFDRTKRLAYLDAATVARRAVAAAFPSDGARQFLVGATLWRRYQLTAQGNFLDEAITAIRVAARTLPDIYPNRPGVLSSLGSVLLERCAITGDLSALDEAVTAVEAAEAALTAEYPNGAAVRHNVVALREIRDLARHHGILPKLAARPDNVELAPERARVAEALVLSFDPSADPSNLDLAIRLAEWVLSVPALDIFAAVAAQTALGGAMVARFMRFGNPADLDMAVHAAQRAVDQSLCDDPEHPRRLAILGTALRTRFEIIGDRRDLDAALTALDMAAATAGPRHPAYSEVRCAYGAALLVRFAMSQIPADLDAALTATQAAVDTAAAGKSARASFLTQHGQLLAVRFEQTADPVDLDAAIAAHAEAVEASAPTHPEYVMIRWNLAAALGKRWDLSGDPRDADRARVLLRQTLDAMPTDDARRALLLTQLAATFGDPAEAIDAYRQAATTEAAFTRVRLVAARQYGSLSVARGDYAAGLAGYRLAVEELLPRRVPRRLTRVSQQNNLQDFAWLASDAAAAAIEAEEPAEGLRLLEQGRSILWSQTLDLRSDRSDLRDAHPELAMQFDQVCTQLEADGGQMASEGLRAVAERYDWLLAEIRELPGFATFLRPPSWDRLLEVAAGGPVAVINISRHRCDALLLRPGRDDVLVRALPGVTAQDVSRRVDEFFLSLRLLGARGTDLATRMACGHTILESLEWLWDSIVEPVLTALGLCHPLEDDARWPRLWWCPTGPLALLPLHAAGRHGLGQDGAWVGDRVVSSYTPTLQALRRARSGRPSEPLRILGVGLEHTPNRPPLPAVRAELAALNELFGARHSVLVDEVATKTAILAALPNHSWAHFACHGYHDADDPSASYLAVHDGPLTVVDIARHDLANAELAFLSACNTANSGRSRLEDEAIHLVSAFQLAGYRHVIGTLWNIDDRVGPILTSDVYGALTAEGSPCDPALALHRAIRRLRHDPEFARPAHWAPFVHIGP